MPSSGLVVPLSTSTSSPPQDALPAYVDNAASHRALRPRQVFPLSRDFLIDLLEVVGAAARDTQDFFSPPVYRQRAMFLGSEE
jgi:hypothetical protein